MANNLETAVKVAQCGLITFLAMQSNSWTSLQISYLQPAQSFIPNPASSDSADSLPLEIPRSSSCGGNIPLLVEDLPVSWQEISHQQQNAEHFILSNWLIVASCTGWESSVELGEISTMQIPLQCTQEYIFPAILDPPLPVCAAEPSAQGAS